MDLPILMYHSVSYTASPRFRRWVISPSRFDEHMAYLRSTGYVPMTVTDMARAVKDPSIRLPERVIGITFDDGFEDFHINALPILARYAFPATLYITAGFVGKTSQWLYNDGESRRSMLSWQQIYEIAQQGIEIGAHSLNHLELDTLPAHQAEDEITASKEMLEKHLKRLIESFAYPYGYHNNTVRELVVKAGFSSACAVKHGLSSYEDDPYALARIIVPGDAGPEELARLMAGQGLVKVCQQERPVTTLWRYMRRARRLVRGAQRMILD